MSDNEQGEGFLDDSRRRWSQPMLEQAARSIEIAHGIKSTSWCIHSWKGEPFVAVGAINIISMGPSKPFGLLISVDSEFGLDLDSMAGVTRTPRTFAGRPWATYVHLDGEHLAGSLDILRQSHEDAVRRQAKTVKDRTLRWKWHREDFWAGVQEELDIRLPKPGYAEELRVLSESTKEQPRDIPLSGAARTAASSGPFSPGIPEHEEGRRYWKIDCGRQAQYWPIMRDHEIVALENWSHESIHLDELPADHHAFVASIKAYDGIATGNANHAWRFLHEISPGDVVVPIRGQLVYGWGLVTGDYTYVDDDLFTETGNSLPHRKPTDWYSLSDPYSIPSPSQALARQLWGIGPRELSYDGFVELMGGPAIPEDQVTAETTDVPATIRLNLAANGLHYTDTQIASFYTALQTKGFVVMSGISGTGKSKIATGFVEMLPGSYIDTSTARTSEEDEEQITFQVRPYMRSRHQIRFAKRYLERFPLFTEFRGTTVPVVIGDTTGTGNLRFEFFEGRPGVSLWMHRSLFEVMEAWTLDDSMIVDLDFDDENENVIGIRIRACANR